MALEVRYERDPEAIRSVLTALPDWFGDPVALDNYVAAGASDEYSSLIARESGRPLGVALVRRHFHESAELHLIAVEPTAHSHGIGRSLIERMVMDLGADGCSLLSVHTVGPSYESDHYSRTREFYRALGFLPLEEHIGLDWRGPTLILVRAL